MHQLIDLDGDVVARAWCEPDGQTPTGLPKANIGLILFNPAGGSQSLTTIEAIAELRQLCDQLIDAYGEATQGA